MSVEDQHIGAWATDQAALAGTPLSGRGNDADAPNLVRFRRNVFGVVRKRELRPDAEFDDLGVFFLANAAWLECAPDSASRNPFLNTGNIPLTKQVHAVNEVVAGRSIPFTGNPEDLPDFLKDLRADTMPTVVYISRRGGFSTLSWYPKGLADESDQEVFDVTEAEPTVEHITKAIDSVHNGQLMTPDQLSKEEDVWVDSSKGWAHENAEARVQRAVRIGLLGRFPQPYRVLMEQPDKQGRTDIEILEDMQDRHEVKHHAVLELKVLREKGSTGNPYSATAIDKHMDDGVNQAHSYGEGRNFEERMLCCFDMRATNAGSDVVFAPLREKANQLRVHLRHWFLYRSSEHFRACKVANALKPAKTPPDPH